MAQANKRILIVDDEKDAGRTFEMILKNYGFDVDCFTDPAMALTQFKPDLYEGTLGTSLFTYKLFKLPCVLYFRTITLKMSFEIKLYLCRNHYSRQDDKY